MQVQLNKNRFRSKFLLLSLLSIFVIAAMWLAFYVKVSQKMREMNRVTVSVKVKPSRMVAWGETDVPVAMMKPEFESSLQQLRPHWNQLVLLIEVYENASYEDAEELADVGRDVGFDVVTLRRLSWPYGTTNLPRNAVE